MYIVRDNDLGICVQTNSQEKAEKLFGGITGDGRDASLFKITPDGKVGELERIKHPQPRAATAPRLFV